MELREISTRAKISPARFWNEYQWGNLRADPAKLVERYFDAHLYFANWGTHRLMLRIPASGVDAKRLRAYFVGDPAKLRVAGSHLILDLQTEDEGGGDFEDYEEEEGSLAALAPLRVELMHGDLRGAYLAWLLAVQSGSVSGTHDDMIIGNVVTDVAGNGISIGKFTVSETTEFHVPYNPTDKNEICTNDTIKDNYIHNVTTEFQGATGIAAGYPKQVDIEHNEIAYVNYTGVSVGYGWTNTVNAMSNNYINYNNIHHVTQIMADGAALYVLSNQQPASQMEYNFIHDYQTSQWADYGDQGIYLDEQTSGYTIAHNAMVNAPMNVAQNNTGTNTITDNPASNSSSVSSMAGIEASYADIKNTAIPLPTF
ncbi:MAG TPA: right-handed parallel beta-helix repeat-containing protein [Polyangiaceae bacterium]